MDLKECDRCHTVAKCEHSHQLPAEWIRMSLQTPYPQFRIVNFDICPKCKDKFEDVLGELKEAPKSDLLEALEQFILDTVPAP